MKSCKNLFRPIPNVITFCDDITSESCRVTLRKHLATWKADVVLNDGAPNVGQAWSQDAFSQGDPQFKTFFLVTSRISVKICRYSYTFHKRLEITRDIVKNAI